MARARRYQMNEIRLYGVHEAALYLGIERKNLTVLKRRGKMIPPLAELKCGPVWSESQLDEQLYTWKQEGKGPTRRDELLSEQYGISSRLRALEQRYEALVDAARVDSQSEIVAIYQGRQARARRSAGLRPLASLTEARRAAAEAKLLGLVADLADKDPVFAGIRKELDEATKLRKRLDALKKARAEARAEEESLPSHTEEKS